MLVTALLLALVEIGGRVFSDVQSVMQGLAGMVVLASIATVISGHFVFFASVLGLAGLLFGLRADKTFLIAISIGLVFGAFILYPIYFA